MSWIIVNISKGMKICKVDHSKHNPKHKKSKTFKNHKHFDVIWLRLTWFGLISLINSFFSTLEISFLLAILLRLFLFEFSINRESPWMYYLRERKRVVLAQNNCAQKIEWVKTISKEWDLWKNKNKNSCICYDQFGRSEHEIYPANTKMKN